MADRDKTSAKSVHNSLQPIRNTNLRPPISLADLNVPVDPPSPILPDGLTPPITDHEAALRDMDWDGVENEWINLGESPDDSVQGKLQEDSPKRSMTKGWQGLDRAFIASKIFQQVIGHKDPQPFVPPPQMPNDLEQRFTEGLEQLVLDRKMGEMGLDALSEAAGIQDRMPQASTSVENTNLEDIMEEKESPAESATEDHGTGEGADASQFDEPREPTNCDSTSEPESYPIVEEVFKNLRSYNPGGLGSSATLVASPFFRPRSCTTAHPQAPTSSNAGSDHYSASPVSRTLDYGSSGSVGEGHAPSPRSSSFLPPPPWPGSDSTSAKNSLASQNYTAQGDTQKPGSAPQRSGTRSNPLFPSPGVKAQYGHRVSSNAKNVARRIAPVGFASGSPSTAGPQFLAGLLGKQKAASANVPQITLEPPSPKTTPVSKKRAAPMSGEDVFGPPLKGARAEASIGLPVLPATSEALWKFHFPGNTHALLTILLTWSHTIQSFYRRLPDPKAFQYHSAFPFRVTPPVYQHLVSLAFYDTSVTPHKEIRFLGPGDAAEIGYGEVDTFRSEEDWDSFLEQQHMWNSKFPFVNKESRHTDQVHNAVTGEGRWVYFLVKGHTSSPQEIAPHVILATHSSSITEASTCLHTILPDEYMPLTPLQPSPKQSLRRFASLQNLMSGPSTQKRLYQLLRSASSSELPPIDSAIIASQEGAQTLRRTVLKMEKAGFVPLIEGYRVDVGKFRAWMDAVGKGRGKIILWRERAKRM
ncbi:hypothetical protein EJ02DRAFT_508895 [Clathrospora elynae]|uniref:Uncharacterized protein n=1 Tax=Clathrospora elynae TaxID=706981 RepID=A0A6A5T1G3_9PLEO|nr:hypothetical protein EJ02DRAFT_508895 [Clathrospora elynae]